MRTLQLSFSPLGGAGRVAINTANMLNRTSALEVQTYFLHSTNIRRQPLSSPKITALSILDEYLVKKTNESSMVSLFRSKGDATIPREHFDVIHLHWWQDFDLGLIAQQNPNTRFVITLHDDRAFTGACHSSGSCTNHIYGCRDCPIVRAPFRKLVRHEFDGTRASLSRFSNLRFVAPTERMKNTALKSGLDDFGSIDVIPNPVDQAFLPETNDDLPPNNASAKIKLGFIAENLEDPNKRFHLAVELVQRLNEAGIEAELEAVGNSKRKSPSPHTAFLGHLSQKQISVKSREWSALLVSSEFENAPMSIVEMALLGVPTITHSVGGTEELLGLTGQRVLIEDWRSISDGDIKELSHSLIKNVTERKIEIARLASANFGHNRITQMLLEVYGEY